MSRRDFLRAAGVTGLGLLTAGCRGPFVRESTQREPNTMTFWTNAADYTMMWWADGLRDPGNVFNIQTSRYGLSFDADDFVLRKLGPLAAPPTEAELLTQDNSMIEALPEPALGVALNVGGESYPVVQGPALFEDAQLIESGTFFQRRWLRNLRFAPGAPGVDPNHSGLEIAAWPDRVAFTLRVVSPAALETVTLEMYLTAPSGYRQLSTAGDAVAFGDETGAGFVVLAQAPGDLLEFDAATATVTVRVQGAASWAAGEERSVGLIVYPVLDAAAALYDLRHDEEVAVEVRALQVLPASQELTTRYDRRLGWTYVGLRNDGDTTNYAASSNDRIEQVTLTVTNPTPHPRTVRLNFGKEGRVFGITGLSAILRDTDHHPLGLPVQLSKNWHTSTDDAALRPRFEGPWYHGLTMITVPPEQTITFEYVSVNALWGTLPAASHAQLCLVGWGSNQLWDQAAIGSWGESLCFEPDQGQAVGAVLDTRPLMVWAMWDEPKRKWGWTHNVGGADFLVYYDQNFEKQYNSRMRTHYRRYGPNLTEVTYAGRSLDRKIDLQYTVSLYRSDDITRGVYRFRYNVREPVDFSRLVFFQAGGDDYSYTSERAFAWGNEEGLHSEWETEWGGYAYRTERIELKGRAPWVSMHRAVPRSPLGAWANRGLVVRRWDAKLGGARARPWIAERGATIHGEGTSLVEFLPPPGVTRLKAGDYVEAELVHIVMPQSADDYYGPNTQLSEALQAYGDTWRMIHREATGNAHEVKVQRNGKLAHTYPIRIQATGAPLTFTVTGGIGYLPVTITHLPSHAGYRLEQNTRDGWIPLDQSHHGNDFWQTDFDPTDGTWELTYSLPLDSPGDVRLRREFRLEAQSWL
jgi:hypothetical protein